MTALWSSLFVVVLLGAIMFFSHLRFGGTDLEVTSDAIVVSPVGFDRLWSMRRRIVVLRDHVRDVGVVDRRSIRRGFKLPGAYIPGWITAGRFVGRGMTVFWNVHRATRVLVIDIEGGPYDRLVLEVDDPDAVAALVDRSVHGAPRA